MEMGPVLVVTFQAQQIAYIADANGKVVEGDPVSYSSYLFSLILIIISFRNKSIESIIFLHLVVIRLFSIH